MKVDSLHLEIIYNTIFSHFKQQDELRNNTIAFFTTITGAIYALGFSDHFLSLLLFLVGFVLSMVLIRYKYYGDLYSIHLKAIQIIWGDNLDDIDEEYLKSIVNRLKTDYSSGILKIFNSADGLIYTAFILINFINLYQFVNPLIQSQYVIIIYILYFCGQIFIYYYRVVNKIKNTSFASFSFLQFK